MTRSSRFESQIGLAKCVLKELTKEEKMRYTVLMRAIFKRYENCSTSKFTRTLRFLLSNSYVIKPSRGVYQITKKGKAYLEVI